MTGSRFPAPLDGEPQPPRDGKAADAGDGTRSGEGADTALEILIRKRKQAELPVDLESLGDLLPPAAPTPPPA
jgi:hypothetical protein